MKNTIPLCRDKNDSVKNKLIIRIAKEMWTKSFVFIAFFIFTSKMISNLGWKHNVELDEGIHLYIVNILIN